MKRRDPNQQLEFLLAEVVRLQMRVYNQRFRATGLKQSQVTALIHLDRIEELSQTELADRLGMRKAATGTLIEGLEDKGLLERRRSQEDRRLQLVSITDAGRQVVDEVDHMAEELGTEYRRGITRSERRQLVSVLQRLRDNLRRVEAHLGIDGASDRSFEAIVLGVVDTMTPGEGLLLVGVLQVAGFLALVVWRRRRGVRLAMGAAVVVALLGGARLVYRQWYAPPSGVVLSEEIALRAQPHASLPATLELRAGEVVTVEESSDRWMRVVHPRGAGWTRRVGVGVVD